MASPDTVTRSSIYSNGILSSITDLGQDILGLAKDILTYIPIFIVLLASMIAVYFIGVLFLKHGHEIIANVEFGMRCELYPEYAPYANFAATLVETWEIVTCWYNSLGLTTRLFSYRFLLKEAKKCISEKGTFLRAVAAVLKLVGEWFKKGSLWLFSNPITKSYPLYPIATYIGPIFDEFQAFLVCECAIAEPLYKILLLPFTKGELYCAMHQLWNGMLNMVQVFINSIVQYVLDILSLIMSGNILDILTFVFGSNQPVSFYQYMLPFDKFVRGLDYLGEWLNIFIRNMVCVIVSEAIQGANGDAAVEAEYNSCLLIANDIDLFCLVSKVAAVLVQVINVLWQAVTSIFRFINPIDDFRYLDWKTDLVWDTIRTPLTPDGPGISLLPIPSNTSLIPDCNTTYDAFSNSTITNATSVICTQCNRNISASLGNCLCNNLATKLDNIIENEIGVRFMKPILCDLVFGAVRVLTAVAKWAVDFLKSFWLHIIDFIAIKRNVDRVIDELGGPPDSFNSGFLYAPNSLMVALLPGKPNFECIVSIFTFVGKALAEALRGLLHLFVYVAKDINGEPVPITFLYGTWVTNFVCIYDVNNVNTSSCFNPETVFQWIRLPRDESISYKNEVPIAAITGGLPQRRALECLCSVINLEFLNEIDIPELLGLDIPDLCCFLYNMLRTVFEFWKLIFNAIISLIQTILELTALANPKNRIFFLEYFSCLIETNATSSGGKPCSNINLILNDLTDIIGCGCIVINDFITVPGVALEVQDLQPLICLCDGLTAINAIVSNALIEVVNLAQLLLGVFQCIDSTTGMWRNEPQCNVTLPGILLDFFDRLGAILVVIGDALENLVCSLAVIFYYDCANANLVTCIAIDFEGCVRQSCPSFNLNPPIIGNQLPTTEQYNVCVGQCGASTCTTCVLTLAGILQANPNYTINCPNPCQSVKCRPSDRLKALVGSLFGFIQSILDVVLSIVSDIFIFAINAAVGTPVSTPSIPFSITGYVDLILTTITEGLLGNSLFKTWGILQYFGDTINCLIGPPGCNGNIQEKTGGIYDAFSFLGFIFGFGLIPGPIAAATLPCLGNPFILVGNVARDLVSKIIRVIVTFLAIIESILAGQTGITGPPGSTSTLGNLVRAFVVAIFDLILTLLNSISLILDFISAFISGVVAWIVGKIIPGTENSTYTTVKFVFDILFGILKVVIQVIGFIVNLFKGSIKRFLPPEMVANWTSTFYPNATFEDLVNNLAQMDIVKKRGLETLASDFQQQYNLTNDEMTVLENPALLLPIITTGTYCHRVMTELAPKPYAQMTITEEALFKYCYIMVVIPIINNKDVQNTGEGMEIPADTLYNIDTMATVFSDATYLIQLYQQWSSVQTHSVSLLFDNGIGIPINGEEKKKRDIMNSNTVPTLISTINFTSFYDFVNKTQSNSVRNSPILNVLKKADKFAKEGTINSSIIYQTLISEYLNENPNHLLELDQKNQSIYKKFGWYWDDYNDTLYTPPPPPSVDKKRVAYLLPTYKRFVTRNSDTSKLKKTYKPNKPPTTRGFNFFANYKLKHYREPPGMKATTMGDVLFHTYHVLTRSIPRALFGGASSTSSNNTTSPKRGLQQDEAASASASANPGSTNILGTIFYNIYVDRINLVTTVLNKVGQTYYKNLTTQLYQAFVERPFKATKKRNMETALVGDSTRPSLPERVYMMHQNLKRIKVVGNQLPDLPPSIVSLAKEINRERYMKRSLVDIDCGCNCTIIDDFVQQLVDTATYCYEKQVLMSNISLVTYHGPVISIRPISVNASAGSFYNPEGWINGWIGFDLFGTIIDFTSEVNRKPQDGPIGLLYFISPLIPFGLATRPCERVNLTCEMGMGLEKGFVTALLIVFIVAVGIYLINSTLGGITYNIVVGLIFKGALLTMLFSLTVLLAWGYEAKCASSAQGTLLGYLVNIPLFTAFPLQPECAARQLNDFFNTYIFTRTALDGYSFLGFKNLLLFPSPINYTTGNNFTCSEKVVLQSCYDYGIQSPFAILGMGLLYYFPEVAIFLRRFTFLPFFDGFNVTTFANTNTSSPDYDPILQQCFIMNQWSAIPLLIFTLFAIGIILVLIGILKDVGMIVYYTGAWAFTSLGGTGTGTTREDMYYERQMDRFM